MWSGIYPDVAAVMANNLVAGISNLKFKYLINLFICGALFYKNFTLDLVKEQKWGTRGEDGLWNGMLGGLQVLNQKKSICCKLDFPTKKHINIPATPLRRCLHRLQRRPHPIRHRRLPRDGGAAEHEDAGLNY